MCSFYVPATWPVVFSPRAISTASAAVVFAHSAPAAIHWPGQPVTAHWGIEDPAAVSGDDETKRAAFLQAFATLQTRIALLSSLKLESLDRIAAEQQLERIATEY
jgi:hypothetical protein